MDDCIEFVYLVIILSVLLYMYIITLLMPNENNVNYNSSNLLNNLVEATFELDDYEPSILNTIYSNLKTD